MTVTTVRILLLGVWTGFFVWIVSFGQSHLARLLHPDLWWLVICAAVILLLFLLVNCRSLITDRHHGSHGSIWWQWPSLATLLVPLIFFLQAQDARFNADTFSKRTLPTAEGVGQGDIYSADPPEESESSDISLAQLIFNIDEYLGKEVEVVCQTFINDRLPKGIATCYRYSISCCAADARPLFIFIEQQNGLVIESDKWIRTKGILSKKITSGVDIPLLPAESVEYVDEPSVPYIY